MAYIRQIAENTEKKKWAYVEYSDENKDHFCLIGDKEFDSEEEAIEHSKLYNDPFSYEPAEKPDTTKQVADGTKLDINTLRFCKYLYNTNPGQFNKNVSELIRLNNPMNNESN